MGVVYVAHDKKQGREVALKRLALDRFERELDRTRAIAQFEREYYTLSQLAHPHVIEVYDYGLDASGPYYTMERLHGVSLRERVPLPWREACSLMRDIASALALVHSRRYVHRDITPLNVYCTPDAGAKLIDFGAMIPAGVAPHIQGTPAFIAPECLQRAALDGQTDLFSFGATLYYALTGHHAYHAHTIAGLRESWLTPPRAVALLGYDVPTALEELLQALLSLDASQRPRSSADVHELLTAIADLPRDDRSETWLAYLSKPVLVGRADELATIRHSVELATRAQGGSLIVVAGGGMGRSRLLDAAVLEAKLSGLSVARADAAEGPSVPAAVIQRLVAGMLDETPALRETLEDLGLGALAGSTASEFLESTGRDRVLGKLNELWLRACADRTWVLVVDDVHAIDEMSLAFIGSLALQARSRRLLLVTGLDTDAATRGSQALTVLDQASRRLRLNPLDAGQCRSLLGSLFGEVPNLDLLATLSESVCEGKPRSILEAAERLIERGLVRYRDGRFSISAEREALASAVASTSDLAHELAQLSAEARELLEALSLDVDAITTFADYPSLLDSDDHTRMHAALSELISRSWLTASLDRARFRREDRRQAIAAGLEEGRSRQLHARLAERARQLPISKIYAAHHFLRARELVPAVDALDSFWRETDGNADSQVLRRPVCLETFELAMCLPSVSGAHPTLHAHHAAAAAMNMLMRGMPERVAPQLPSVLRSLAPFSGVQDYAELTQLAAPERALEALKRAHARCDVPGKGGLPDVFRALRRHAQVAIASAVTASMMNDPSLLELIPDLRPFSAIAAPLGLAARMIEAITELTRGRMWQGMESLQAVLGDLRGPLAAQLDPLTRLTFARTTLGYLGRIGAELGSSASLALIDEDANLRSDLAETSRSTYWLAHADLTRAEAARRRAEVFAAQAGSSADTHIVELQAQLALYPLFDDVLGLRRTQHGLQQVTATRPQWRVRAELASTHALRCQGAFERALQLIESVMREQQPETSDWHACAATHVQLLSQVRRHAEAARAGEQYLQLAAAFGAPCHLIRLMLSRACAELGNADAAERLLDEASAELRAHGAGGVVLAALDEVGARNALTRGDRTAFGARLLAWAEFVQIAKHPQLVARYNSLVREAELSGASVEGAGALAITEEATDLEALRELATAAVDDATFYRRLLELLLEHTGAAGGVLYASSPEGPRRVAQCGEAVFDRELDQGVARYWSRETTAADLTTASTQSVGADHEDSQLLTSSGHAAKILRLDHVPDDGRVLQGVLVLDLGPSPRPLRAGLARFGAVMAEHRRPGAR